MRRGERGPRASTEATGALAETAACAWLAQRGLKVIARNYRCRLGEIDLIALDGRELVFVEVRLRNNPTFGTAADSITARKRLRLIRTAQHFLACFPRWRNAGCRFDVMAARQTSDGTLHWDWLKQAFEHSD